MWVWKQWQNSLAPKSKICDELGTKYLYPETLAQNTLDPQGKASNKWQV